MHQPAGRAAPVNVWVWTKRCLGSGCVWRVAGEVQPTAGECRWRRQVRAGREADANRMPGIRLHQFRSNQMRKNLAMATDLLLRSLVTVSRGLCCLERRLLVMLAMHRQMEPPDQRCIQTHHDQQDAQDTLLPGMATNEARDGLRSECVSEEGNHKWRRGCGRHESESEPIQTQTILICNLVAHAGN